MMHPIVIFRDRSPRGRRRLLVWGGTGIAIFLYAVWALFFSSPPLPIKDLSVCQERLSRARKAGCDLYVPELDHRMEVQWNRLLTEWHIQNTRPPWKRDFRRLLSLAQEMTALAEKAEKQAIAVRDSLRQVAETEIRRLEKVLSKIENPPKGIPNGHVRGKPYATSHLVFLESRQAFQRGDYQKALSLIRSAGSRLRWAERNFEAKIDAYRRRIPLWKYWADRVITQSREEGSLVLVVDKYDHVCIVYRSGEPVERFSVEFGPNWMDRKLRKGDRATPEGIYRVVAKREGSETQYYKALDLDYPNQEDIARFEEAKKKGLLPSHAEIGGMIAIHGEGGRGEDWTNGCVAFKNRDMDRLFEMVPIGTPVAIVGSMNRLRF